MIFANICQMKLSNCSLGMAVMNRNKHMYIIIIQLQSRILGLQIFFSKHSNLQLRWQKKNKTEQNKQIKNKNKQTKNLPSRVGPLGRFKFVFFLFLVAKNYPKNTRNFNFKINWVFFFFFFFFFFHFLFFSFSFSFFSKSKHNKKQIKNILIYFQKIPSKIVRLWSNSWQDFGKKKSPKTEEKWIGRPIIQIWFLFVCLFVSHHLRQIALDSDLFLCILQKLLHAGSSCLSFVTLVSFYP